MRNYNIAVSAKELQIICNALALYRDLKADIASDMDAEAMLAEAELQSIDELYADLDSIEDL